MDDEPDACALMRHVLEQVGYTVTTETTALGALERVVGRAYDLMLTDVSMPEMDGIALCRKTAAVRPGLPIVLITGRADMVTVTRALRVGVRDFLTKPLEAGALLGAVTRIVGHPAQRRASELPLEVAGQPSELKLAGLLGESEAMRKVRRLVVDLADSVASVVIQGETGTGKEIIAQALHATSPLSAGPFIALNCAAMPSGLLETELFGHGRGAFTDAKTAKKGLLLQADGGTLFLDEIGELPLLMQPKLLRALQERTVRPVGEHHEIPFNCRIIAAANQDLEAEVKAKRFREDLFYRLDVVRITVPPLRARDNDVLLLANHFLTRFVGRSRRVVTLSSAVAAQLLRYGWPGNVRELENCMERAVALARTDELSLEDLPERVRHGVTPSPGDVSPSDLPPSELTSLFDAEREHVLRAVEQFGGNKTRAASLLGIDRRTLHRRLERYESKRGS
ncbi:MAG TPA: sigma-54 dependent transcriptional regulator [Polyangiaceae bacterium]|nr:sigma-54 dependent transcriptional regulator [Polyangiaceae bacterium]